nr:unnamed protein product [Callosobruchus analis]
MASYSSSLRRSVKWYRKIAVEVLTGTALVNAWHLYKLANNSSIHITTFRENLCMLLLKSDEEPIPGENNADQKMQPSEKRTRCKFCYKKYAKDHDRKYATAHSKQVLYVCPACPGSPAIWFECFFTIRKSKLK